MFDLNISQAQGHDAVIDWWAGKGGRAAERGGKSLGLVGAWATCGVVGIPPQGCQSQQG